MTKMKLKSWMDSITDWEVSSSVNSPPSFFSFLFHFLRVLQAFFTSTELGLVFLSSFFYQRKSKSLACNSSSFLYYNYIPRFSPNYLLTYLAFPLPLFGLLQFGKSQEKKSCLACTYNLLSIYFLLWSIAQ